MLFLLNMKSRPAYLLIFIFSLLLVYGSTSLDKSTFSQEFRTWEMIEITLEASNTYQNQYTDVTCWVDLEGPDFSKRIYGFWDGGSTFKVRIVLNTEGRWFWKSGSDPSDDEGLNGQSGEYVAKGWSEDEKSENPNRRGFVGASPNGHALQYADGTPYFMTGDTWLAGTTWRLPFRNAAPPEGYVPGPGIGFEDAVTYRKNQGFNSVSMIASFPNWDSDTHPATYPDPSGTYVRNAWEKFDYFTDGGDLTSKDMRDEYGHRPFEMSEENPGIADFDQINPSYFRSLDKKMHYLSEVGFVPLLETVRRDNCPTWKAYSDFNESYARYVQYLISRYGAYNMIFSGIHLDWIPELYSLTAEEFNKALSYHLEKYGPLPFGQIHTTLINNSTYTQFGHADDCPWLTMHSVGNKPRDHRVADSLEILFRLNPPYPAINFEPYYTGWNHEINRPGGERPPANSERDNYFSRAMMYGSVLSGGLSGHVHGTAAYDITTTGEPEGMRPHIWNALQYESGFYMQKLKAFIMSEEGDYQNLELASHQIHPRKAPDAPENGLDGWSYMMKTPDSSLAMLYFEIGSALPTLSGFIPGRHYLLEWYNPVLGSWSNAISLDSDKSGYLTLESFPGQSDSSLRDHAAKIKITPQ